MKPKFTIIETLVYGFLIIAGILVLLLAYSSPAYFVDNNVIYGKF